MTSCTNDETAEEDAPLASLICAYLAYLVLFILGHIRDFFGKLVRSSNNMSLLPRNGYAPIVSEIESFYSRHVYKRIQDCFNRIIAGAPGAHVAVNERYSNDTNKTFTYTGKVRDCINLGSYNYLGFASPIGLSADSVESAILSEGSLGPCSTTAEAGMTKILVELEEIVARFIGAESAVCLGMGFATNSTVLPALVDKGCLILSDELNHASLVFGARLSGAAVQVFKHNSPPSLEKILRQAIATGQPRTHRPWRKILVVIEGLYSMEGTIAPLPAFLELKKRYKFYLYMDEAHSIGAVGPRGRGVCDYYGVDPQNVDILMGTFTKSFGSVGGYIAGSKSIISHLRTRCHSSLYAESLSIPAAQQIITASRIIMNEIGILNNDKNKSFTIFKKNENIVKNNNNELIETNTIKITEGRIRLAKIAANTKYFRQQLHCRGFIVYGQDDSPVVPLLIFLPSKLASFSRECLKRGVAVVVVGAPATPIVYSRARFCLSSAHSKEDIENVLQVIDEVGDLLWLKMSRREKAECDPYGSSISPDLLPYLYLDL